MQDILIKVLTPLVSVIVCLGGMIIFLANRYKVMKKRNDILRELVNVMGAEYGMMLSKDKDGNDNVSMKPDFREKLTETYNRYRKQDLDKDK